MLHLLIKEILYKEENDEAEGTSTESKRSEMRNAKGSIEVQLWNLPSMGKSIKDGRLVQCQVLLPGDNPLRNSKTSVLTENPQKSTSEISREYPSNVPEPGLEFNRLRNSGAEPDSYRPGERSAIFVAPESDVSAFKVTSKEECGHVQKKTPTRRTRNTKQPIIEVVY